jgi:hypothetical protein
MDLTKEEDLSLKNHILVSVNSEKLFCGIIAKGQHLSEEILFETIELATKIISQSFSALERIIEGKDNLNTNEFNTLHL